ncbi:MAG: hypothetical protein RL094_533 [Candidatus Parcubacteria bacterium]|jgi:CRISPR/Cas system-associated exonuclease Cas4 (RecB family)
MAFSTGKKWVKKYDPKSKEQFKLSRSKIDMFIECPRCFYLDRRLGVGRPASFPFNLNSAVDHLLKKEFDVHRADSTAHPLMSENKIDAIPFAHDEMDTWRENFVGVQFYHEPTNFLIFGAVDDVWINKKGELIVVDYKSTSKDSEVNLDAEWQDGYKRQMEVYQWLLRNRGFDVSDTGYFVYANATKDRDGFDSRLEFNIKVIPYKGNADWIDDTLGRIKECLDSDAIPKESATCDYCRYRTDAGNAFKDHFLSHKPKLAAEGKETKSKKKV